MKKALACILSMLLMLTMLPTVALAAGATQVGNASELANAISSASSGDTIELAADIRRADAMNLDLPAQKVAYHLKFAQPMLCLVMIFLAIPFALRVRRGGVALGFGVSVIIGLAYISLFYICVGLGYISKLPPAAAAWIPTIVFGLLGLELFRRLPT